MTSTAKRNLIRPGVQTGIAQAIPIVLGYVPIGIAFGVLATKAGISPFNTVLMSIIVYAGSSQLIATGLVAAGAPPLSIVATTFVVNLRHLLLSAAISPYLKRWRKLELVAYAFHLTDEAFALHSTQFPSGMPPKTEIFSFNIALQIGWVAGSWVGTTAGQWIADVKPLALDYTLPALFIALLVFQLKTRTQAIIALATGTLSVALLLWGMDQWYVITATIIGATIGATLETWLKKPSS